MPDTKPQLQKVQRIPSRIFMIKTKILKKLLHLSMLYSNIRKSKKKKMLKGARGEKHLIYREEKIRITSTFSEAIQTRRE